MTRRRVRAYYGAALLLAVPRLASAQMFEGAITMRVAGGMGRGGDGRGGDGRGSASASAPATQEIEFLSRNGNVRVNAATPAGAVAILLIAAENKTYAMMEAQKAYMDVTPMDAAAASAPAASAASVTRTGKRETIAGVECEHVMIESSGVNGTSQKADLCLTKALGPYVNPLASMGGGRTPAWQQRLATDGGFPLKVTLADGTVALEVIKIEKRRVSDALFRIPPDFNKMSSPKRP